MTKPSGSVTALSAGAASRAAGDPTARACCAWASRAAAVAAVTNTIVTNQRVAMRRFPSPPTRIHLYRTGALISVACLRYRKRRAKDDSNRAKTDIARKGSLGEALLRTIQHVGRHGRFAPGSARCQCTDPRARRLA